MTQNNGYPYIHNKPVEKVEKYHYLGAVINNNGFN